jgi:hypothetical protein
MTKDLTIILEDRPGTLADMGEALGTAGINIDGMCGFPSEGKGVIHLLVEDATGARSALEGAGIEVGAEREVLVVEVDDRPGAFGDIARKIANEGVNSDLVYMATNTRLVVGTNDLEKTRSAL